MIKTVTEEMTETEEVAETKTIVEEVAETNTVAEEVADIKTVAEGVNETEETIVLGDEEAEQFVNKTPRNVTMRKRLIYSPRRNSLLMAGHSYKIVRGTMHWHCNVAK